MTKLTDYYYQGRRVIGPFPPDQKPTRVGAYPARAAGKDWAREDLEHTIEYKLGAVCVVNSSWWDGAAWLLTEGGPTSNQNRWWYALEEPKE